MNIPHPASERYFEDTLKKSPNHLNKMIRFVWDNIFVSHGSSNSTVLIRISFCLQPKDIKL